MSVHSRLGFGCGCKSESVCRERRKWGPAIEAHGPWGLERELETLSEVWMGGGGGGGRYNAAVAQARCFRSCQAVGLQRLGPSNSILYSAEDWLQRAQPGG